ncbi:MAG: right-handed parallel beta-helix repeat-containing protein, partial [Armatimonadota bacterium]|nr:right-handed parallel beta-helix repeat-containing protein [Armatimonadota bacterium]
YLDRETGVLYFWPPAPLEKGEAVVSVLPSLVQLNGCSHVVLRGFRMEACRGTAVGVEGGTGCRIEACTFRNLGGGAVRVSGGTRHLVAGCDIYDVGEYGVSLNGGDRPSLTPAGHVAENNHIHHYGRIRRMYQPGISLGGVGNVARHNLIDNAPHMAIFFTGNDHLMELNEIHSVCHESNDAGAIYAGRDWTMRGNVIRHNYLHHINGFQGRGCVGVYLDDMFCGVHIYGNVFYRVTNAAFIGGGRDNIVENNIFVECDPAVHVDARALGWAADSVPTTMKSRLDAMPYQSELWKRRYPQLVNIWEDEPAAPKGNVIARNIYFGGRWEGIEGRARPLITFVDNLLEGDPRFVDPKRLDFRLRKDSPAWKLGFKPIPMEQIGLKKDAQRASWPVESVVRPTPPPPPPPPRLSRRTPAVFRVPRARAVVNVDGVLAPAEWLGLDPARAMPVEQGIEGEKVAPRSLAWLWHDGQSLFVAVENAMDPAKPMALGNTWGQNEAVELALRAPAGVKEAPIRVLRGYATGVHESSGEAGAPPEVVRRAGEGVLYAARVESPSRWTAEWRIPLASLALDAAKPGRVPFNLSVRKAASNLWLMWQGTGAHTWDVDTAGLLELQP